MGVSFGTLEPLEIWPNTWYLIKSHYSRGKKNNISRKFRKKKNKELHFLTQIDDDITVWPGIISGSPQTAIRGSHVWEVDTLQGLFPNWNSDCRTS